MRIAIKDSMTQKNFVPDKKGISGRLISARFPKRDSTAVVAPLDGRRQLPCLQRPLQYPLRTSPAVDGSLEISDKSFVAL